MNHRNPHQPCPADVVECSRLASVAYERNKARFERGHTERDREYEGKYREKETRRNACMYV